MYQFFFKKSLYNFADTLSSNLLVNLLFMLVAGIFLRIFASIKSGYLFLFFTAFLIFYIIYALSIVFNKYGFKSIFKSPYLRKIALAAIIDSLAIFSMAKAVEFYFGQGLFIGYILGFIALWILLFYILSSFLHMPLIISENLDVKNAYVKGFIFTITDFPKVLILAIVSTFSFATNILPIFGFAFGAVMGCNMASLLIKKEKYIVENIDNSDDIKKINWKLLLKEENERLGNRTFKDVIFPWKQQ